MKDLSRRDNCRLCKSTDLQKVLQLRPTPPANELLGPETQNDSPDYFPLDIYFCNHCKHVQLLDIVNPNRLFAHYVYMSGVSKVFQKHFKDYAEITLSDYKIINGFAVDIGSNDGTLLSFVKELGNKVLGVDPAIEVSKSALEKGVPTINAFFDTELAHSIVQKEGKASIIYANNVFAHIDSLEEIVQGVNILLDDEGVFCFEVSYLGDVLTKTLFDTIYHEHLSYHSVGPLVHFFKQLKMKLIDVQGVDTHGGSIRVTAAKDSSTHKIKQSVSDYIKQEEELGLYDPKTFLNFGKDIEDKGQKLKELLLKLKAEGKTIAGFGYPAKATTLLHHFNIGSDYLEYIIDDTPLKQGKLTPGFKFEVKSRDILKEKRPDYLLILAWNFSREIQKGLGDFTSQGGKLIVPLPNVEQL